MNEKSILTTYGFEVLAGLLLVVLLSSVIWQDLNKMRYRTPIDIYGARPNEAVRIDYKNDTIWVKTNPSRLYVYENNLGKKEVVCEAEYWFEEENKR